MVLDILSNYVRNQCILLYEWSKCGDSAVSTIPTILWAIGSAALAYRLITALFKRFLFRRVPPWEILLQHLVYLWMVIYCLYFWAAWVNILKYLVESYYRAVSDGMILTVGDMETCKMVEQALIWMCGASPIALYIHIRPRIQLTPVMIWIPTNPWHRREMGAYEYYLTRPIPLQSHNTGRVPQTLVLKRAYSDSRTIVKERPRKRSMSKSI